MLFIPMKELLRGIPLATIPLIRRLLMLGMQIKLGGTSFLSLVHLLAIPKCTQDWLVKQQFLKRAQFLFANTCANVTTDGRPHPGAAIGSTAYVSQYVSSKINGWVQKLQLLSSFAITQPHTA